MQCDGAHTFHKGCIETWVSHEAVCPLCKFQLPTAPVTRIAQDLERSREINEAEAGLAAAGSDLDRQRRRLEAVLRETAVGQTAARALSPPLTAPETLVGRGVDLGGLSLEELGLDLQVQEFLLSQAYDREGGGGALHADASRRGADSAVSAGFAAAEGQSGRNDGGSGGVAPPPSARTPSPMRRP